MPSIPELEPPLHPSLEAQCRRIAVLSMAIERIAHTPASSEVLDLAEALDAHFNWEPFRTDEDEPNEFADAALGCLRVVYPEDLDRAIERLPVFPLAAERALSVILQSDWNASQLEWVAASDQALASHLLRAANSWAHSPRQRIETIPHAITYIGAERTARILYAAAMQPMLNSPVLRDLWHHSVASAEVAQSLGEMCGLDRKKAFLAGLVHDVGALAMVALPAPFPSFFAQLTRLGCDSTVAERVLSGISHAEAGARALAAWNFPPEFCEAVEFHHAPEKTSNRLASLLYLCEQWTDAAEDAPSAARFRAALASLGTTAAEFEQLALVSDRTLAGLV